MVCARARFLTKPRYLTLTKPHRCLTTRNGCSPRARVRERAQLIFFQRAESWALELGRRSAFLGRQDLAARNYQAW